MRRILIGIAVLLVIGIAALLIIGSPGTGEAQSATAYTGTTQVERTTLYDSVDSTGAVTAEKTFQLSFGASGTVEDVLADIGDSVTEGQPLATLDTTDLAYQVHLAELSLAIQQASYDRATAEPTAEEIAQARANLIQAQSQLESAQASAETADDQISTSCASVETDLLKLEDAQTAYDDYLVAGYEMDATFIPDPSAAEAEALHSAETAYENAQAQCHIATSNSQDTGNIEIARLNLEQAQAAYDTLMAGPTEEDINTAEAQLAQSQYQLEQAQADLDSATIRAPFDGVITDVQLVRGQAVNGSEVVMTIADTSRLHVDISVDELDILQIATGQDAQITLEAFDSATIPGTVVSVSPAGAQSQGLVTYTVRVDLDTNTIASASGGQQTAASSEQTATSSEQTSAASTPAAGFIPSQANAQASGGSTQAETAGGSTAGTGFVPGQGSSLRAVMPVLTQMGGVDALTAMLAREGGEDEFYAQLRESGVTEETITAIQDMGGPQALVEMLSQRGFPAQPGSTGQDATQTSGSDSSNAAQTQTAGASAGAAQTSSSSEALPIRLGMTAEVKIVVSAQENVLVVPTTAIQRAGDQQYLLVDDGTGTPQSVPVTTGDTSNGKIVVSGNITEGQVVYIPLTSDSSTTSSSGEMMPGGGFSSLLGGGRPG